MALLLASPLRRLAFTPLRSSTRTRTRTRTSLSIGIGLGLGVTLGLSSTLPFAHSSGAPPLLLLRADAAPYSSSSSSASAKTKTTTTAPVVSPDGSSAAAWLRPAALKQLSAGSVCGLLGGVVVGVFSKPLAVLLGLAVFGVQALQSSLGISLLPYNRIQRMFGNVNVRSLLLDNAAFKLAFGATFALAAFAEF